MINFFKNQIIFQMLLAQEVIGKDVVFDSKTGEVGYFERENESDGIVYYTPLSIVGETRPISELPLSCFSAKQISENTANIDSYIMATIGQIKDLDRLHTGQTLENDRLHTGQTLENDRLSSGISLDKNGNIIGHKSDNDKFLFGTAVEKKANIYGGETANLMFTIETGIDTMLKRTKKDKTKNGLITDYKRAIQFADKKDLNNLIKINKSLINRKKKQAQMKQKNKDWARQAKFRRKLKIFIYTALIVLVILTSLFFIVKYKINTTPTPPSESEQGISLTENTFNKDEIIEFIESYENKNKCVIYPYRRNIIIDSIINNNITKQRAFEIIDSCYLSIQ